jgi:hypothetical protein
MCKRCSALAVAAALLLLAIGALWAQYGGGMAAKTTTCEGESNRCTMTCTMLMNHYNKKFETMKAHEGDKQCWQTCWTRMGKGGEGTAQAMKSLWTEKMAANMRVNQCAQACWRKHHGNASTVEIGGWRSTPRSVVCTP